MTVRAEPYISRAGQRIRLLLCPSSRRGRCQPAEVDILVRKHRRIDDHARPCPPPAARLAPIRCILLEREVSACPVIVREIAGQDAVQVAFAQDEDVIQTFAPDRANEPLREGVLPRALGRGQHVPDSDALHAVPKRVTVDAVPIAEEVGWRGVVRERLHNLLGGPARGGTLGDVEVDDTSSIVGEHDEDEEDPQARGGTVKKSRETRSRTWLSRNVRQV
jgi:hypothetical protein